jgi:hypothetical protein
MSPSSGLNFMSQSKLHSSLTTETKSNEYQLFVPLQIVWGRREREGMKGV